MKQIHYLNILSLNSLDKGDWLRQLVEKSKTREESIYWQARGLAIHDFIHVQILKYQLDL